MKNHAIDVEFLRDLKRGVHKTTFIEEVVALLQARTRLLPPPPKSNANLLGDNKAKIELLLLENRNEKVEEANEMAFAIAIRNDDGDAISSSAISRSPNAARLNVGVYGVHLVLAEILDEQRRLRQMASVVDDLIEVRAKSELCVVVGKTVD